MLHLDTRTQQTHQISGDVTGADASVTTQEATPLETPMGPTPAPNRSQSAVPTVKQPGQMLGAVMRTVRNVAAGTAIMGMAFGLTGCNLGETPTEPRPYEPMQVHMSAGEDGVALGHTGESRIAADLRIALHHHANRTHEGSRSRLFLHHAGDDSKLSSGELIAMMEQAKVGKSDIGRMLGAKAAMAFRDANQDGQLSWGEFKPVIYAPSEIAEGK